MRNSCYIQMFFTHLVYPGLLRSADWAKTPTSTATSSRSGLAKRTATNRAPRTATPSSDIRATVHAERKITATKLPPQPSSRPQTPSLSAITARPTTPSIRGKPKNVVPPLPSTLHHQHSRPRSSAQMLAQIPRKPPSSPRLCDSSLNRNCMGYLLTS